jgi:hypothetical protein
MSFLRFLVGAIELAAVTLPLYLAAVKLARLLLPGWEGAASRLAEVVLVLSGLIVVVELVGVIGLYRPGFVIGGSMLVAAATVAICRRYPAARKAVPLPVAPVSRTALGLAIVAALAVTYQWASSTQVALDGGMFLPDTTWQNAPFAARFVQETQIGLPHFTDIFRLTVWFYPQNSELLHSIGVLTLGTDVISAVMSTGWMVLALLAGWVVGRPYGVGPAVVAALAIMFATGMLVEIGPGDAKTDVLAIFGLLAAVAFLVNGEAQRRASGRPGGTRPWDRFGPGPLVLAALAAGLAAGTRLNFLIPVLLLTLAVVFLSYRGERLRTAGVWVGGLALTSGFWFLRNLVVTGNPLPWVKGLGPVALPHPEQLPIDVRAPGTVIDYITDGSVVGSIFIPAVRDNFGDLWVLVVAASVVFTFVTIFSGRTRTHRALGLVALASFIAYLFTPLTAAGSIESGLTGFTTNVRYVAPAMAIAFAIGPLAPAFGGSRVRRRAVLAILLAVLLFTIWPSAPVIGDIAVSAGSMSEQYALPALVLVVILVVMPIGLTALWRQEHLRRLAAVVSVAAGVGLIGLSYARTDHYVQVRYSSPPTTREDPEIESLWPLIRWAQPLSDRRIGIVGNAASFKQYFLYGNDLSNRVYYVGERSARGGYLPIESCSAFRRRVNELDLDYLVTTGYVGSALRVPEVAALDEATWIEGAAQAQVTLEGEDFTVFRLDGQLDPGTCPG